MEAGSKGSGSRALGAALLFRKLPCSGGRGSGGFVGAGVGCCRGAGTSVVEAARASSDSVAVVLTDGAAALCNNCAIDARYRATCKSHA